HPEEGMNLSFLASIIAVVISTPLAFLLTYFFGNVQVAEGTENKGNHVTTKNTEASEENNKIKNESILSPIPGIVIPLSDIEDPAFSSGALGKGIALNPEEGNLTAPVSGEITALFPTNHAIGITSDKGVELLIHIGMDTVQLEGQYFASHVAKGEKVAQGQLLIEFDIEKIKESGKSIVTPVVVTNQEQFTVEYTNESRVSPRDELLFVEPVEENMESEEVAK